MKCVCAGLFVGACFLFYFGSGMLFLVPGDIGESYVKSLFAGRFLYGVVPFLASFALIGLVGWLWDRSNGSLNPWRSIQKTYSLAAGSVLLFWIVLLVIAGIRNG
jgi:hypothetical protein